MNCPNYIKLLPFEKIQMVGQIIHLMQNDTDIFNDVEKIITAAKSSGKLSNVEILPENKLKNNDEALEMDSR